MHGIKTEKKNENEEEEEEEEESEKEMRKCGRLQMWSLIDRTGNL